MTGVMTDMNNSRVNYAGLGRRFLALFFDFLFLSLIFFVVTKFVRGVWVMSSEEHLWSYGWFITDPLCIGFLFGILGYFVVLESVFGATVGKRLMCLRVVMENGQVPGLWPVLVRNVLRLVDALPTLNILGVILIMLSPENARFGDRIARTRVIMKTEKPL